MANSAANLAALDKATEPLHVEHVGVFTLCDESGRERYEIQSIDDTKPDGFDDHDALLRVIELAGQGNRAAIAALYLDGRSPGDARCWFPAE